MTINHIDQSLFFVFDRRLWKCPFIPGSAGRQKSWHQSSLVHVYILSSIVLAKDALGCLKLLNKQLYSHGECRYLSTLILEIVVISKLKRNRENLLQGQVFHSKFQPHGSLVPLYQVFFYFFLHVFTYYYKFRLPKKVLTF